MNICQTVITDGWAGAETVVHELARHLRDRGENVCILTNQEALNYYADLRNVRLLNAGPFFHTAGLMRSCISPQTITSTNVKPAHLPWGPFWLNALLREVYYRRVGRKMAQAMIDNKVDMVHSHLNAGIVLASNLPNDLDIPIVATLHGQSVAGMKAKSTLGSLGSPVASWRRERFRTALGKADRVTAVSNAELDAVKNCDIPLKDDSVVIPNGVNVREIQSSLPSTEALKGEFNLLFPGGTRFVKGGDLLIRALATVKRQIAGVHLYIAGDIPQNHLLRKMAVDAKLASHVTFTGFLGIREYRQLLSSVDLLVMPSREESFGIAFLEAMALGKPVVGGNTGGIPELVKNGRNGTLVRPDPDQIAEAILHLYRNAEARQKISQNNLEDVTRFDWGNIVQLYIRLYQAVVRHRGCRPVSNS